MKNGVTEQVRTPIAAALLMACAGLVVNAPAAGQAGESAEPAKPAMEQGEKTEATEATTSSSSAGKPVLMSEAWVKAACDKWNEDELLTDGLAASEWVDNDGDKGYKVMHLSRKDCESSAAVEMQFERKDNKAICVYGGKVQNPDLDPGADYYLFADTPRWIEMGNDEYGPMAGMMFGRLKFKGPKMEAMGNMGPFKNFLLLVGKIPSDTATCP